MDDSGPRASAVGAALLVALSAWAAFPLILLLVHAAQTHTTFTGADGLIGADGVLGADQLQYLAWARDASAHGLASDLFSFEPSGHVYLEPMFSITGLLFKLGLSLPLAYLLWKPVAVLVLVWATLAWARRAFPEPIGPRVATAVLALFLYTPVAALVDWTQTGSNALRFQLYLLADELLGASKLWGYVPSAIGLALVPAALLSAERALDPDRGTRPGHRALRRRLDRRALILAAFASLLAAWLHPWQGITLVLIFIGLGVWQRHRGGIGLVIPAVAAGLPLAYYYLLGHTDPAWQLASHYELIPRLGPAALLLGFGPLVLVAAFGLRDPGESAFEQLLILWIVATFVTYFVNDAFAPHALQGLSFPLAVLIVRGWRRLRIPALLAPLALLICTVPGLAYQGRKFVRAARSHAVQYYLPAGDAAALGWIAQHGPPGGVLAPAPFAVTVPSQTGRNVWVGHGYWSRNYFRRKAQVNALFAGHERRAAAQRFVIATRARLLLADCAHRHSLDRELGALIASVHRFGCARIYVVASGRSASR
ncbi:MAG: hypothetical protein QOF83_715 [Solirubrobacteraceae bacterium]|nr:hypothetical protein [Solirubrobacteraceae bacterium]